MKKDIVDIVTEKEFIELTAAEREELKDFCTTEEEYNQLKGVFLGVEGIQFEQLQPKKEVKESLDNLFYETYPKASPVWYNSVLAVVVPKDKPIYRQPLLQVAAVLLLVFLAIPLVNSDLAGSGDQMAENTTAVTEDELVLEEMVDESNDDVSTVTIEQDLLLTDQEQTIAEVETESDRLDMDAFVNAPMVASSLEETATASGVAAPGSTHPDGVFIGSSEVALSLPASESEDLLDLLTATF